MVPPTQIGSSVICLPAGLVFVMRFNVVAEEEGMAGSISPWPVVKSGSNAHPVKTLQYLLRARGHSVAADGVFGPNTEAAVKAFQSGHGLVANGIVDAATWAPLVVPVKQGSRGDAVKGVQEEFQFRNLSGDPSKGPQVDCIFGGYRLRRARFSARPFARHSIRGRRRHRRFKRLYAEVFPHELPSKTLARPSAASVSSPDHLVAALHRPIGRIENSRPVAKPLFRLLETKTRDNRRSCTLRGWRGRRRHAISSGRQRTAVAHLDR